MKKGRGDFALGSAFVVATALYALFYPQVVRDLATGAEAIQFRPPWDRCPPGSICFREGWMDIPFVVLFACWAIVVWRTRAWRGHAGCQGQAPSESPESRASEPR
jgi:hypothetical protein